MAELATGYVSIVAQTGSMQRDIQKALSGVGSMGDSAGQSIGSRLSSGISKTLKVGVVGAGAAVGATLAGAITKGFGRLQAFDQAEAKFRGLGKSAEEITTIMDGVNDAVSGTVFGLDEAAGSAAKLSGVGVEAGEEMNRMMTLTADIAAQAGRGMGEMDSVMAKILGSGKLTGETLAQLDDAATGASGAIASHLNVSIEEMRDMVSKGGVDVETFATAMEGHLGGAAQAGGETFSGAMSMVGSALGRLGATLIGPLFEAAPKIFGALTDSVNNLHERVTPLAETFGEWLAPKMEDFANNIGPMLETAIENVANFVTELWEKLTQVSDWYSENSDWINSIAAAIGGAAGAFALWTGAIKTWQAITKTATALQVAFNAVMAANPIMLVVMAIAALVAGLVYFFTQTETGKEVWNSLVEAFSAGWEWVKNAFQTSIDAVVGAWTWLTDTLQSGWDWVKTTVIDAWNTYWALVQSNFALVTGALMGAWNWLRDIFVNAWNFIKTTVVDAFNNAWNNLQSNFDRVMSIIKDAWQFLQDALHAGWTWIDENVLGGFRRGMDAFKSFFENVVDGIKSVWDGLRSALAKPINFMINTVYNDGILRAWNTIAGFLPGLDEASPLAGIPERAEGGSIFGPGTETSDSILARLSNNEHVWTAREVRRAGGHGNIYAMRSLIEGRVPFTFDGYGGLSPLPTHPDNRAGDLLGAAPDLLPAYRDGGEVRPMWEHQLERAHEWAKARHGRPYVLGGSAEGGGGTDCSGFMSGIANVIQGGNGARQWATMAFNGGGNSQQASGPQGFVAGLKANTLSIGVTNGGTYGGHTAGTLGSVGSYGAVNVESGGSPSMVKYGAGAAGADDPYFRTHYHLPIGPDGAFVSGGIGGMSPEAMMDGIKKKISDLIDKAMDPILSLLPEGPPEWLNIPKGAYDKGKGALLDGAFELVGKLGDKLASVWTAAGQVNDLVTGTVRDAASWVNNTVRGVFVRDQGGLVPHGAAAVNTSGKDELMLPPSTTAAFNKFLSQMPGTAGALERAAVAFQAAAEEMGLAEQARKSAEDYATTQAGGFLSTWGLEGLVPLAVKAGAQAWEAYQASPYDVGVNGQTIVVEYVGDENDREWKMLQKLDKEVALLKAKRKPKASAHTRGGVM